MAGLSPGEARICEELLLYPVISTGTQASIRSINTAGSHIHRYFTDTSLPGYQEHPVCIPSNEFPLVIPEQMTTYLGSKVPYRGTRGTEKLKRHTGFRQIN